MNNFRRHISYNKKTVVDTLDIYKYTGGKVSSYIFTKDNLSSSGYYKVGVNLTVSKRVGIRYEYSDGTVEDIWKTGTSLETLSVSIRINISNTASNKNVNPRLSSGTLCGLLTYSCTPNSTMRTSTFTIVKYSTPDGIPYGPTVSITANPNKTYSNQPW